MKIFAGLLVVVCMVVFGIIFLTPATQGQLNQIDQRIDIQSKYERGRPIGKMPVVDFSQPAVLADTEERRRRNIRFDKSMDGSLKEDSRIKVITESESWIESLAAVPLERSDLIIAGSATKVRAYLSQNKSSVYSEYEVRISEILYAKDRSSIPSPEQTIVLNREGGSVRFPSGHVQTYQLAGSGSLEETANYLIFLRKDEDLRGYILLTAYKVEDEKVYPIDNVRTDKIFHGMAQAELLKEIARKISMLDSKEDSR